MRWTVPEGGRTIARMDDERDDLLEHLREAVERKTKAADEASHHAEHGKVPRKLGHSQKAHAPYEQGHTQTKGNR
jgi:hypothetical protein